MNHLIKVYFSKESMITLLVLTLLFIYSKILCPQATSQFWPFTIVNKNGLFSGGYCYSGYQFERDLMGFGVVEYVIYAIIIPPLIFVSAGLVTSLKNRFKLFTANPVRGLIQLNRAWIIIHIIIWEISRNISLDADRVLWPFGPTFSKSSRIQKWLPNGSSVLENRLTGYDWKDFIFYVAIFSLFRAMWAFQKQIPGGFSSQSNGKTSD